MLLILEESKGSQKKSLLIYEDRRNLLKEFHTFGVHWKSQTLGLALFRNNRIIPEAGWFNFDWTMDVWNLFNTHKLDTSSLGNNLIRLVCKLLLSFRMFVLCNFMNFLFFNLQWIGEPGILPTLLTGIYLNNLSIWSFVDQIKYMHNVR